MAETENPYGDYIPNDEDLWRLPEVSQELIVRALRYYAAHATPLVLDVQKWREIVQEEAMSIEGLELFGRIASH